MAPGKLDDSSTYYQPLPPDTNHRHHQQTYIVLPIYLPVVNRCKCRRILISAATLLLLATAVYILWPSDPDLSVVRLRLSRFQVTAVPHISLDITLDLTVKVRNPDIYSLSYSSLNASIGYKGKQLGFVTSNQGHIRARGSSYVNATLEIDGIEILSDTILLIEDLARGSIPFDTVTEVEGHLGLFFFDLPLKGKSIMRGRHKHSRPNNCSSKLLLGVINVDIIWKGAKQPYLWKFRVCEICKYEIAFSLPVIISSSSSSWGDTVSM